MYKNSFCALTVLVFTATAHADVVNRIWWMPSISVPGSTDPFPGRTTHPEFVIPSDLTVTGLGRYGSSATLGFSGATTSFSEDHYVEFSLTPTVNHALEVHDLILQVSTAQGNPFPISNLVLRTELDGFTSDIPAAAGPGSLQGNTGQPVMFDLESLPAFDEEFTFRLYGWHSQEAFAIIGQLAVPGWGMWFGDVDVTSVPSPHTAFVLGIGALGISRRRRS